MIKQYLKWLFNKDVLVLIGLFLFFIVPFSVFTAYGSILAIVWFVLSEILCTSFGVWYFTTYKKKME